MKTASITILSFIVFNSYASYPYTTGYIDSLNHTASKQNNIQPTLALNAANKALQSSVSVYYAKGIGDALFNLGLNFYYKGKLSEATKMFLQSLEVRKFIGDKMGIARNYNILGILYDDMAHEKMALEYHYRAYQIYKSLNHIDGIASQFNNIALIYRNRGENKKTLKFYKASYYLVKDLGDTSSIALYLSNIGQAYFTLNLADSAYLYYQKALKLHREIDNKEGITTVYAYLGDLYLGKKYLGLSKKYYEEAYKIAKAIQVKQEILNAVAGLSKVYEVLGDCEKSFHYYKLQKQYEDSINQSDLVSKLTQHEMEMKFEKEKKQKEIEQLKKDILNKETIARQKNLRNVFIFGFVFMLMLAGLIFRFYKIKQKDNKLLALQKKRINDKNEELMQQKEEILVQRDEIESQNKNISRKNKLITDSIRNAFRIQQAILPPESRFQDICSDYFIFYSPKDIVSGDYYWLEIVDEVIFLAVVDCTGHGVSGALMSMLSYSLLNQAIYDQHIKSPAKILDWANDKLYQVFKKEGKDDTLSDSMDIVLCALDKQKNTVKFAGAKNTLVHFHDNKMDKYKGDIHPIGQPFDEGFQRFNERTIPIKPGDSIYMFTDGFSDQFGGEKNRKYTKKQLIKLFENNFQLPMNEQYKEIEGEFHQWKGNKSQVDDVLILGIRC